MTRTTEWQQSLVHFYKFFTFVSEDALDAFLLKILGSGHLEGSMVEAFENKSRLFVEVRVYSIGEAERLMSIVDRIYNDIDNEKDRDS